LAAQRELIYKQRDEILIAKNNFKIIKNMSKTLAKEICTLNINPKNEIYVDENKIANILNRSLFNNSFISPEAFKNKTINEASDILTDIIKLSIDLRYGALNEDQSTRILKQVILDNLDHQ
jgi:preprotein translocase subunit SecA